jgi:hypothetical protein
MKHLLLIAFAILITACETAPPPIEFTFEKFELIEAEAEYPKELGRIKDLECYPGEEVDEDNPCQVAGYTRSDDIDALEAYKIRAEGNTDVAQANAEAIDSLLGQAAELVSAGIASENIQKIREEQVQTERRARQQEKWYYRLMLLLVGAAGVYASQ